MIDRFLRRPKARAQQVADQRAAEHAARSGGRVDVLNARPDLAAMQWILVAAVLVTTVATLAQVAVAVGTAQPEGRLSSAILNGMPLTAAAAASLGLRLGRPRLGGHAFVGLLWLEMAIHIAFEGGTSSPSFGSYPYVVLAAGLVLGVRTALIYGVLTIVAGAGLAGMELAGMLPAFSPTLGHRLAAHVARVVAGMGILWVSMRAVVQAVTSARSSQRSERRLRGRLSAMHAVTLELSREREVDRLYRRAVEEATRRLGLGRAGLWLTEDDRSARGTWGIDEQGDVRAEHDRTIEFDADSGMGRVLGGHEDLVVMENVPLRDDRGRVVGHGWQAIAALRSGTGVQGCLSVDGFLLEGPPPTHLPAILRDYAASLDHLVRRLQAERALRRREQVLGAVGNAARRFLDAADWTEAIEDVLRGLGEAAGVGRVFLGELDAAADGGPRLRQTWRAAGVAALPASGGGAMGLVSLPRWRARLERGDHFALVPGRLSEEERSMLTAQGTHSLVVVPVGTAGSLWGFVAFDDVSSERRWLSSELDALRAAAALIGAAIERSRSEQALREAQRMESVGVLAGGVAHDFNNLLTGVLGQATIALALLDDEEKARAHVEKSIRSAEQAASLVRQLLAYAGRGEQAPERIELAPVMHETMQLLEAVLPRASCGWSCRRSCRPSRRTRPSCSRSSPTSCSTRTRPWMGVRARSCSAPTHATCPTRRFPRAGWAVNRHRPA